MDGLSESELAAKAGTSVEQVREHMAKTTTRTGLSVAANIIQNAYEKGRTLIEGFKKTMRILFDNILPRYNYRAVPTPS